MLRFYLSRNIRQFSDLCKVYRQYSEKDKHKFKKNYFFHALAMYPPYVYNQEGMEQMQKGAEYGKEKVSCRS